jgi:multicomponent Na+:H+ antiporter subunit B
MRSLKDTRAEVILALIGLVLIYIMALKMPGRSTSDAVEIFKESGVPNLVTSVYLFQRVYDTVFEVLVFSIVVMGVTIPEGVKKDIMKEDVYRSVSHFMSFFIGIASVYLALTGHVYQGGGFTAGVVGGTALLLMGISRGINVFENEFEKHKVPFMEKIMLSFITISTIMIILLRSTSLVPLMNFLIYFKVMTGTWMITFEFIRRRGII